MNSLCIHFVCVWSRSARFMPVPCGVICLSHWSQFCVVSPHSTLENFLRLRLSFSSTDRLRLGCEPRTCFLGLGRYDLSFYETAGFMAVSTRGGRDVRVRAPAVPWRSGAGASTVVPRSSDKSNLDETRPPSFHDRVGYFRMLFSEFGVSGFTPSPLNPPPRLRAPRAPF